MSLPAAARHLGRRRVSSRRSSAFGIGFGGRRSSSRSASRPLLFAFELFLAAPRVLAAAQARFAAPRRVARAARAALCGSRLFVRGDRQLEDDARRRGVRRASCASAREQHRKIAGHLGRLRRGNRCIWLPVEFRVDVPAFPLSAAADAHAHDSDGAQHRRRGFCSASAARRRRLCGRMAAAASLDFALHFAIFAAIAIPLGIKMHFLVFAIRRSRACVPCRLRRSEFCFLLRGPRNFCFAGFCRICSRERLKNQWAGLVGRVRDFWPFAYLSCALSELEIRAAGHDRRIFLRARVDENALALPRHAGPRARGYFLAHPFR